MNRAVIAGGAAVVGVLAAMLLFRAPDTGGDVPEAAPRPASLSEVEAIEPLKLPEPDAQPVQIGDRTVNPGNAAIEARRSQPDAVAAGQHASAWSAIRMHLVKAGADKSLALEVSAITQDLREARMRPDSADFATLGAREAKLLERVDALDLGAEVDDLLARLRDS